MNRPSLSVAGWFRRGTAAIADQGLFAVGNFLLNIMLARWLASADYGAFAVAFSVFLLIGTMHTALLTEPMLVYGSAKHSDRFSDYVLSLMRLHWVGTAVGACVLGVAAGVSFLLGERSLATCLLAFAIAGPIILLTWLARRACYVKLRPELAAVGGAAYLTTMLLLLIALRLTGWESPVTAVIAMGMAGLVALVVLLPLLGVSPTRIAGGPVLENVLRDHFDYGRWALGTALLGWVPSNLFVLVLPLNGGLEASGAFRALLNLLIPMMQATSALGILALPALVRVWSARPGDYARIVGRLSSLFVVCAALYGVIVYGFRIPLIELLYGGRYLNHAPTLSVLAAVPSLAGLAAVLGSALRAVERPELVFRAYLLPTLAAATVGVFLVWVSGVHGAGLGWLLVYSLGAISLAWTFVGWWKREQRAAGGIS